MSNNSDNTDSDPTNDNSEPEKDTKSGDTAQQTNESSNDTQGHQNVDESANQSSDSTVQPPSNLSDDERKRRQQNPEYAKLVDRFKDHKVTRKELMDKFDISLMSDEDVLYSRHKHILPYIGKMILPLLMIPVMLYLYFTVEVISDMVEFWVILGLSGVFIATAIYEYYMWKFTVFVITTDKLIHKQRKVFSEDGIWSYNKYSLPFSNLADVEPNEDVKGLILRKLFGWGYTSLDLTSTGTGTVEQELTYVEFGQNVSQLIEMRQTIQQRLRNRSMDDFE